MTGSHTGREPLPGGTPATAADQVPTANVSTAGWDSAVVLAVDLAAPALAAVGTRPAQELTANATTVLRAAGVAGAPVVLTTPDVPGPAGQPIPEALDAAPSAATVARTTNNAWASAAVRDAVRATRRGVLVVLGVATDVGVGLTAMSARADIDAAFAAVYVVVDAAGTVSSAAEQAAWLRMTAAGVALVAWSGLIGELQGDYTRGHGPQLRALVGRQLGAQAGPFHPSPEEPYPGDRGQHARPAEPSATSNRIREGEQSR